MSTVAPSRITNRDLFALTLRYAMESDLAIERYAKYKGEKTPSLFGDDDKPSWITVGAHDHHGGHPVQIEKKTGKMITGHFAGMTLAEAFGPVGKKHVEDHKKPDGIASNERLPLFDRTGDIDDIQTTKKDEKQKHTWDTLPDEAINGFNKNALDPLRHHMGPLDHAQKNLGSRYAWEAATAKGHKPGDPHPGTEGKKRWIEAAKKAGIDNAQELADNHPEMKAMEGRLNDYRGWGDESEFKPKLLEKQPEKVQEQKLGNSVTGNYAMDWMKQRSKPMKSFGESLRDEPKDIPESGIFEGKIPRHMVNELHSFAKDKATRTQTGKLNDMTYNLTGEDGNPYALTLDHKTGDAKLTFDHRKEDEEKPAESMKTIPLRERKAYAESLAKGGMMQTDIADHLMGRGIASVDARRLASDATFAASIPSEGDSQSKVDALKSKLDEHKKHIAKLVKEGKSHFDIVDEMEKRGMRLDDAKLHENIIRQKHNEEQAQSGGVGKKPNSASESPAMGDKPGIVMPSQTVANEQAKPGDQLGLFGEATKAKVPTFKPKLLDAETKAKQGGLFDTKGNPDQMDLFGGGGIPEDMTYKPTLLDQKKSDDGPKDGDKDENGLVFRDGRWHREGEAAKDVKSMSPDELAAHIESQPIGGFATTRTEDWGSNRGQGKRMGGMVRGAMSDPPKGVKTYVDRFGKLSREEQEEASSLDGGSQNDYAKARNAGLSHDDAMVWAYEKNGEVEPGFTHKRMNEPKDAPKPAEETPKPKQSESSGKTVKVGEFRDETNRIGDAVRSVSSAANQKERANEIERLRRTLNEAKDLTSSKASENDRTRHANAVKQAQELIDKHDRGEGGASLPKDEAEQLENARNNPVELDPKVKALFKPKLIDQKSEVAPEDKPDPKPKDVIDSPTAAPSEKAFAAAGIAESKDATPRQVAKAAQEQLDKDYEYARASDVRNAGEDLKGSARHRVNAWKGLADAEKDGTAEKLVNREGLHRLEPHDLMTHADKNPLTSLAMHYAMRNFPPAPAGETKTHSAEKNREQYVDAYRAIKDKANELAASTPDQYVGSAVSQMRDFVSNKLREFRKQADSASAFTAKDKYNPTANLLIKTYNALSSSTYKNKTGVMGRMEEFSKEASEKYGNALTSGNLKSTDEKREFLDKLSGHAKDVIEGQSLNKTFGKEAEKRDVKRFDPSEAYVKIATRKGGRDLSKITADPVKAVDHMVKEMGMRGVQWGNSVTDDERKHHAAKALEAITDLADVTGLHPKDIALDGNLGLAIGARGKGVAAAHYEPGNKVINLTRANGVGTLSHEWGHAFDHMLNGFGLDTTNKGDKVVKKGGYMSNDTDTHHLIKKYGKNNEREYRSTTSEPEKMKEYGYEIEPRERSDIRDAYRGLNKVSKGFRERLANVLQDDVNSGVISSKKANDYWNSDHEIFARSFEQYVMHKMKEKGVENTYLSGMAKGHKYWPTPEESKAMAPAFDKIFEQYRKERHGSGEPVKYSARDVASVFAPMLLEYYSQHSKPFIDDGDLFYDPNREQADRERYDAIAGALSIERYDTTWDESKHHRSGKGTATGGQFTSNGGGAPASSGNRPGGKLSPRLLEGSQMKVQSTNGGAWEEVKPPKAPATQTSQPASPKPSGFSAKNRELADHPDLQDHHSLHIKNQEKATAMKLNDHRAGFRNLLSNATRKAQFAQDDPLYQPDEETVWANVDKTALQGLLTKMNQADHESMKGNGPKFHELANANQIIPKMIAERLHGGSRFFDPEKLRGRWNEPSPQNAPPQEQKQDTLLTPQEMAQPQDAGATAQMPQTEAQLQPEESAQPVRQPEKPKRAPITPESLQSVFGEKLPEGVSKAMNTKLERRIKATIGDDPEIIKAFKPIVFQAWKELTQEANDHNQAIRQVTNTAASLYDSTRKDASSVSAPPQKLTALIRMARSGELDPSQKRGFDLMVDNAQKNFPQYLAGRGEDGFVDWLTDGIKPQPNLLDPEVGERAVTLAGGEFFRQFDQGEAPEQDEQPEGSDWEDQFSWSVARVMVERYRRELFPERYAGKDQLTFNWDEAAHPREPKGADGSKGGEFAKKKSEPKDGYVFQPRAKAGGEYSDVDGKFYKGGAMMPVHGLFSGMEKPPAKEKKSEGTTPIAKEDQDKQPRQIRERSKADIAAERERMEEQRKWDELNAGPIKELFHGWIGDRPNSKAFKGSPGHKFWAPMAERLGKDGVEKLTEFMRSKAIEREKRERKEPMYSNVKKGMIDPEEQIAAYVENMEWLAKDSQHFHTKKHLKAVPNSREGEVWLDAFISDSSIDDKVELNARLKELLGSKEKYSNSPTQAQREAGNYKMEHIRVHGLPISIETPKGSKRRPEWPKLAADYGYFKNTLGKDGDHIDVFVGPDKSSEMVFVIDQVGLNGKFDEHKVLIGFANQADAIATYKRCYHNSWKAGPVTAMTVGQFKNWIASGKHSRPIGKQVSRYSGFTPVLLERYWNEEDHPRGQPENKGEFVAKNEKVMPYVTHQRGDDKYYGLPIESIHNPDVPRKVEVLPNGKVKLTWRATGLKSDAETFVRDEIHKFFQDRLEKLHEEKHGKGFWRSTNNAKEHELAKSGELKHSLNHVENFREEGLSVSNGLGYSANHDYKHLYRVDGDKVGEGSDGEPLLDPKTIKFGKKYSGKSLSKLHEDSHNDFDKMLSDYGWTRQHLTAHPVIGDQK